MLLTQRTATSQGSGHLLDKNLTSCTCYSAPKRARIRTRGTCTHLYRSSILRQTSTRSEIQVVSYHATISSSNRVSQSVDTCSIDWASSCMCYIDIAAVPMSLQALNAEATPRSPRLGSSFFDRDSFKNFTEKKLRELHKNEQIEEIIRLREQAILMRHQTQVSPHRILSTDPTFPFLVCCHEEDATRERRLASNIQPKQTGAGRVGVGRTSWAEANEDGLREELTESNRINHEDKTWRRDEWQLLLLADDKEGRSWDRSSDRRRSKSTKLWQRIRRTITYSDEGSLWRNRRSRGSYRQRTISLPVRTHVLPCCGDLLFKREEK